MDTPTTPEMLAKLPLWAQKHVKCIEGERDMARRALSTFQNTQTPTAISYDTHVPGTLEKPNATHAVCYVPADVLNIEYGGISLRIALREDDGPSRAQLIDLQWCTPKRVCGEVALVPKSFQSVSLISKPNLRE